MRSHTISLTPRCPHSPRTTAKRKEGSSRQKSPLSPSDEALLAQRQSAADQAAKEAAVVTALAIDPAAEWDALSAVRVGDDADPLLAHPLARADSAACAAYAKVRKYARELSVTLAVPEIVLVGSAGCGKSLLAEALLGVPGLAVPARNERSVAVRLVHAPTPGLRVTVRRDGPSGEPERVFDATTAASAAEIAEELAKRNAAAAGAGAGAGAEEPVSVVVEGDGLLDATYIDTPGLVVDPSDESSAAHEAAVLAAVAPAHRLIVVVRPASDAARVRSGFDYVLHTVRKVDPQYTRTVVVYTRLFEQLQRFQCAHDVNRFLNVNVPSVPTFFVTLPDIAQRQRIAGDSAVFDEKLRQAAKRDKTLLEQLQYDKRFQSCVGVPAVIAHFAQFVWKSHQTQSPKILHALRTRKAETQKAVAAVKAREAAVACPGYFRVVASEYAMLYLKTIKALLRGSVDGNPAVNGQSLEQEKAMCGIDGQWVDANGLPIVPAVDSDGAPVAVPMQDNRLYGGQQFERLLSEFRILAETMPVPDISVDDIATGGAGGGIPSLRNTPNTVWTASDLARQKSQEVFEPLVQQLGRRASYVLLRISEIAEGMMETQRHSSSIGSSSGLSSSSSSGVGSSISSHSPSAADDGDDDSVEDFAYFVHFVRDKYTTFVDAAIDQCTKICLDEFYSTRTVSWDVVESKLVDGADDSDVSAMAAKIFDILRKRITSNVLLKFYQYLMVPLDTEFCSELQRQVSSLSDADLEQLFGGKAVAESLENKEIKLSAALEEYVDMEKAFAVVAHEFAHPAK